jgi:hypothetical protein
MKAARKRQEGLDEKRIVLDTIQEDGTHSAFEEAEAAAAAYADRLSCKDRVIHGLDMAKGLDRYEGDPKTYWKIMRSYAANVRAMLNAIEHVGEDTLARYRITVHGIKGASYDVFAGEVGKHAEILEKAAGDGNIDFVYDQNPVFITIARKLIADLEEAFAAMDAENPRPARDKPDIEALAKLRAACLRYDMDRVDAAMEAIEQYQYHEDGGLTAWLRENVDMSNFTQIAEKLSASDR